jgi:hypothetical protein
VPVIRTTLLASLVVLALPATAFAWGGSYPTGDAFGSSVTINVSDSYPVDQALPQDWATYLGSLVHGTEISTLTLDLGTADEVAAVCGPQALACYDPDSETIEATPDDQLDAPPAKEIVTHEYGHHVANNRSNSPFVAESYGTKRWASYEEICKGTVAGTVHPGDEGPNYATNSGEAFAEAYRVLNLTKQGNSEPGWDIVSRTFYPDTKALALLEQDVLDPWTGPTVTHTHGSFGYGNTRKIEVATPLDGTFVARLHAPTKSHMQLLAFSGTTLVGHGTTIKLQICGRRKLTLKVERTAGSGAFTVDVSKP